MRNQTYRRFGLVVALFLALSGGVLASAQEATPGAAVELRPVALPERLLGLSPDGRLLAASSQQRLCVYEARPDAEIACVDLEARAIQLDPETVVWSPDSTRLAFSERAYQLFLDGDLWVMAAATGTLTNVTDDGHEGGFISFDEDDEQSGTVFVDVAPAWSPDGETLAFARSPVVDGEPGGTVIATVPATGGDATTLVEVAPEFAVVFRGVAWSAAGAPIAYSVLHMDRETLGNGVWTVDPATGDTALVAVGDPELGRPIVLALSATGRHAILFYPEQAARAFFAGPVHWLLDLATGQRTPIEVPTGAPENAFVGGVVFSPDGSKLLLAIRPPEDPGALVVRDVATGADEQTIALPEAPMMTQIGKGLDWADDGTVFAATSLDAGVLLHLETGAQPAAAPAAAPTAVPAADLAPGTGAVTNDAAALRVAPSTDAAVALDLPKGTALTLFGPAREREGFIWWPVEEPASGTIGWMRAEFLQWQDRTENDPVPTPPSNPGRNEMINVKQALEAEELEVEFLRTGGARADELTPAGQGLTVGGATVYVFVYPDGPSDREAETGALAEGDGATLTLLDNRGTPVPGGPPRVFMGSNVVAALVGGDDELAAKVQAAIEGLP